MRPFTRLAWRGAMRCDLGFPALALLKLVPAYPCQLARLPAGARARVLKFRPRKRKKKLHTITHGRTIAPLHLTCLDPHRLLPSRELDVAQAACDTAC